jgi:ribosomal protein L40E
LSGLTKKTVYADKVLSTILGVTEGELVSYAQLSQGLHKYIKEKDLKKTSAEPAPRAQEAVQTTERAVSPNMKRCRDCDAEIPVEAVFCDLCGVSQ